MTDLELTKLRAKYLQEASYLLAISSPAAAAFLGQARHGLVANIDADVPVKEYDALRRETCNACGNSLIPGWSCSISTRAPVPPDATGQSQQANSANKRPSCMVYECFRCHRETTHSLPTKSRRQTKKIAMAIHSKPILEPSKAASKIDDKVAKTVNASSKQRQRARKGGLQAMLDKNKAQSSNTSGFDLMDFAM